jgi:hypothetical protein
VVPVDVSDPSVTDRAIPKSINFTVPCGVSIMFAGLMSR